MAKSLRRRAPRFRHTFKAYRAEILKDINLYGELHRFIPELASFYGAVSSRCRFRNTGPRHRRSHYGLGRTFNVLFDIITIKFLLTTSRGRCTSSENLSAGTVRRQPDARLPGGENLPGTRFLVEHGPLMLASAAAADFRLVMFLQTGFNSAKV